MWEAEAIEIFEGVVNLPPEQRVPFIESTCDGKPALRQRLLQMLALFEAEDNSDSAFNPPIISKPPASEPAPFDGTLRFLLRRKLGVGAFGTVYEVWDREHGAMMAAKVLHTTDAEVLHRFKHEFRVCARIRHPNLIRLYELFSDAEQWFFTMELIDGEDFLTYVRPHGQLCLERLRSTLYQIVQAVDALHKANLLHRDLKPENVLVTKQGSVLLLDFGLVRELDVPAASTMTLAGTPAYMSPEQALRNPLTEMSDWYSVGVMLFQALTGKLPPPAYSLALAPTDADVPDARDPRTLNPDIPEDLSALCARMLTPRPQDRPSPAEMCSVLAPTAVDYFRVQEVNQTDIATRHQPFIGRNDQFWTLHTCFREMQDGKLRVVLVEGPSGIGKTATVARYLQTLRAEIPNVVVLRGRCYEFESVPYKGLDALVDELTQHLLNLSEPHVNAVLPREAFLLPRLFPVLRRIRAIANAPSRPTSIPDEQELRQRTFAALREVFARLSDRWAVVIWIDDLQWADRDSCTFLAELCAPPDPPALLLILSYRSEDVSSNPTLAYLHEVLTPNTVVGNWRRVSIEALNDDESHQLVNEILVQRPATGVNFADLIVREGQGHPLFLQQLAYQAASQDPLSLHGDGGTLKLKDVVRRRVAELPNFARRVLEFTCIAAQPLSPRLLLAAAATEQVSDADKASALTALVHKNLARLAGPDADRRVEAFHDQIRTAVVEMLEPETLRLRHARIASILSAQPEIEPQVLVTHYREAGDLAAAYESSIRAAEAAEKQLAFDRAALFYQIALKSRQTLDDTASLYQRLAGMLGKAGRGYDSARAYLQAAEENPHQRLEMQRLAADQFMRSGHIDEAMALIRQLARECRVRTVSTPLQAVIGIVWGRIRTRARLLARIPSPRREPISAGELKRLELLRTAGVVLLMADPVQATYFQTEYIFEALKVRDAQHLAAALALEASIRISNGSGTLLIASALLNKAQQIANETGNANTIGFINLCWTYFDYLLGRIPSGMQQGTKTVEFLREQCTGVAWELTAGYVLLFWFLCWSGNLNGVRELLPQLLKEGAARGDMNVQVSLRLLSYTHYSYLSADDAEECLRESQDGLERWSKSGFHLQHYGALFSKVETYLYLGQYERARDELVTNWPRMSQSLILRWQILRIMAWFLRGRVGLGCWLQDRGNRALYTEVKNAAKRLQRVRSPWNQPTAAVLHAGLAVGCGDRATAIKYLETAYQGFEKISLHAFASAAGQHCGNLRNDEQGAILRRNAAGFLASQQVKNQAAFVRMLLPGDWSIAEYPSGMSGTELG